MRWALGMAIVAATTGLTARAAAEPPDPLLAGAPAALATSATSVEIGMAPPALSSDAPETPPATAEGDTDLSWLQGLQMPDIPVRWDERVIDYLTYYRDQARGHRSMATWLERARIFAPMIRDKLRSVGLPEDLVYVVMVESGFDPSAHSGADAVGLWQFVSRTASAYGLEKNHWVDQRMDPIASTEAAARYLRDLHDRFGTWELALAAYNMGKGALLQTIRKYNTNDYWLLSRVEAGLPYETTLYVAKVMACAVIGNNPERFGFEAQADEPPVHTETVRVPGGVSLKLLARAAGVDADTLQTLNPELLRGRTPPGGKPYPLRIPAGRTEAFRARWAKIRPSEPTQRRYVMRFGESLADVAHRFRTSVAYLRRLNDLNGDSGIGPGVGLLVPDVKPRESKDDKSDPLPVVAVPDAVFVYPGRRRVFYRVSGDDTVDDIASFFRVSVDDLRRWNAIDPRAALQDGMILQIFVPPDVDLSKAVVLDQDQVRVMTVGSDEFFDYQEKQQGRVRFKYTVQPGDTLDSVAKRFGLAVGDLMRINRFGRSTLLELGQEIIVYATPDKIPPDLRPSASK